MRFLSFLFVVTTMSLISNAQSHCDGTRYIERVMTNVDSTFDQQYGANITARGDSVDLYFDVYYPTQEFFFQRPLIILAHGGGFLAGSKEELRPICRDFALRGYVCATIDYRLYDDGSQSIDSVVLLDMVVKSVGDFKAAIRWFRENASTNNDYGIDSNLIFIGGTSAGAIAAIHTAYLHESDAVGPALDSVIQVNGGISGNTSLNHQYNDQTQGVLNYSGAIYRLDMMDEGEPPLLSVHETDDPVVPYGSQTSNTLGTPIKLHGSGSMHPVADSLGLQNHLIAFNDDSHVRYFLDGANSPKYQRVMDSTGIFLEYIICDRISGNTMLIAENKTLITSIKSSLIYTKKAVSRIIIYNMNGQRVGQRQNTSSIQLMGCNTGLYIVEAFDGDVVERRLFFHDGN